MKPWTAPMSAPSDAEGEGNDPHDGAAHLGEAQDVRQEVRHEHRVDHGGDADLRADRQIDVARHDDEHHARRNDGRAGDLHGQRDQVGRAEERAAGAEVEADQDDDERHEHAEEAHVDLGGRERTRAMPSRALGAVGLGVGDPAHRPAPVFPFIRQRPAPLPGGRALASCHLGITLSGPPRRWERPWPGR